MTQTGRFDREGHPARRAGKEPARTRDLDRGGAHTPQDSTQLRQVSVRVPADLWDKLSVLAERNRMSLSELVRFGLNAAAVWGEERLRKLGDER